mgnify:CR=1
MPKKEQEFTDEVTATEAADRSSRNKE